MANILALAEHEVGEISGFFEGVIVHLGGGNDRQAFGAEILLKKWWEVKFGGWSGYFGGVALSDEGEEQPEGEEDEGSPAG